MDKNYWLDRWETGNTRFNETNPHRFLIKYFHLLETKPSDEIFVPLCGKSIDLIFLMQEKRKIIGVEISPIAISQFFTENKIQSNKTNSNSYTIHQGNLCTLHNIDLFTLDKEHIKKSIAIYDRGCLTALPPKTLCKTYISWLKKNAPKKIKVLLICFEHNNIDAKEPPFHTSKKQLKDYFGDAFDVSLLEREPILDIKPHWLERGIRTLFECAYLIQR